MKRKLLILIVLAICTGTIAYSQSEYIEDTLTVMKIEAGPLIDGDIDPEWDMVDFMLITEWGEDDDGNPEVPDADDITAEYKMLWDDDYIYFLGYITDDVVMESTALAEAGAEPWECDAVEFYIAPTLTKLPSMDEMTQIRFSYANATDADATSIVTEGWAADAGYMNGIAFANAARKLSDDGWVVEVKFDLATLAANVDDKTEYVAGDLIGWNITFSDNDGEATRDDIGSWIPDTQWDEADTLGILKLSGQLVGIEEAPIASEVSFYPNPVADELHISSDIAIEKLEIINSVGAMVLRKNEAQDRINVSKLQTGIYFVKIYSDGYLRKVEKFIKE